jgi:hypothetical protein
MVNMGTVTVGAGAVMGAGFWGMRKVREWREQGGEAQTPGGAVIASNLPFSKTVIGQSVCATAAGWFQVYSGGIAIDTVATRLQAGQSMPQALWGLSGKTKDANAVIQRYAKISGTPAYQVRWELIRRSNLFAGHFVTMLARFPYLFTNFNTYVQTEVLLNNYFPAKGEGKEWWKEFACVFSATLISSSIITIAECPKIIDQCRPPEEACREKASVYGIWKTQGIGRLMQGYSACFLREFLFNTALLLSPAMAEVIRQEYVEPNLEDSAVARAMHGQELVVSSMSMGLVLGFLTNGPDQMKVCAARPVTRPAPPLSSIQCSITRFRLFCSG